MTTVRELHDDAMEIARALEASDHLPAEAMSLRRDLRRVIGDLREASLRRGKGAEAHERERVACERALQEGRRLGIQGVPSGSQRQREMTAQLVDSVFAEAKDVAVNGAKRRAYEVTEAETVHRVYVVFAATREEAKRMVLSGQNEPHPANRYEEMDRTRITDTRRAPEFDGEAGEGSQ